MDKLVEALLPCPFCGGAAELREGNLHGFYVRCHNLPCYYEHTIMPTKEGAIAAWNTRAAPTTPPWMPIADAPKDEIDCGYDGIHPRRILAWDKQWSPANQPVVAFWDIDHWQVEGRDDATTHFKPTHFQLLPEPPQ